MVNDGPLSERQRKILRYIRSTVAQRGYPPSIREIGDEVGLKSTSSVHHQLSMLERSGHLRRDPSRPRAIEVILPDEEETTVDAGTSPDRSAGVVHIPLVGEIAAGSPLVADEQAVEHVPLPETLVGSGTLFMLTVRGDSMIEAGVLDGDRVVVRQQPTIEQGEMCAALIDGEATVKLFRRTRSGEVYLDPANPAFEPIPVTVDNDASILGRVTAVLRRL